MQNTMQHGAHIGTRNLYITGFILSILLTVAAYALATSHLFTGFTIIVVLLSLAVIQLIVQLFFFLHLGSGSKAKWNVLVFLFMLLIVLIIVIGSLWIMSNLNYRMTPAQMNQYMNNQSGL